MDLILQRNTYRKDGIFSTVNRADTGAKVCVTLDHAYPSGLPTHTYLPKVMPGTYPCVRGPHRLHHMTADFVTYEVMNVAGHSGILFHWGNWNSDSEGCFLIGDAVTITDQDRDHDGAPDELVTNTRVAFARFIDLQAGAAQFNLIVKG